MIDTGHYLPSLHLGSGSLLIEPRWLFFALRRAAQAAGHPYWWPAEDVAKTVQFYFRAQPPAEPILFENFQGAVRRLLTDTGHPDIADRFLTEGLDLGISLLELARKVPPGFELGFFAECEQAIDALLKVPAVGHAFFQDLGPAVKRLLSKTHWCRACDHLRDEVVAHLRNRLIQRSPTLPFCLSIR